MSDVVVRAEGISKRYRIGQIKPGTLTVREGLVELAKAPFKWVRRNGHGADRHPAIWALRDVSFQVRAVRSWASSGATARAKAPCSKS
jgi:hypothetical protein